MIERITNFFIGVRTWLRIQARYPRYQRKHPIIQALQAVQVGYACFKG